MSLRLIRPRLGELVLTGIAGHAVSIEMRAVARAFGCGGLLLRAANVADVLQLSDLTREAQTLARDTPLWVASHPDEDALASVRPPLTGWPPASTLGHADDLALSCAQGDAAARQSLALGLTLAFGPALDLLNHGDVPRIADLAIAEDPDLVARHAVAVIEASQARGLATCVRHFPGIGSLQSAADTGAPGGAPVLDVPPERLARDDWRPFRAAFEAGASAVLVAHVFVPGLDADVPACWSRPIVEGVLRRMLPHDQPIFADDLARMPASDDPLEHPAVLSLRAGCDVLLSGDADMDRLVHALESIVYAAEQQLLPVARLEAALRRHETMKGRMLSLTARRGRPPLPTLEQGFGRPDDERIAERMREFL